MNLLGEGNLKTLRQFLEARYPRGCYALTKAEAIVLGIPYPLVTGWIRRFGQMEIPPELETRLCELKAMKQRSARKVARELVKLVKPTNVIPFTAKVQEGRADFYDSFAWKKVRYRALLLHGGACQCCGATAKDGVKLHVDHIKPRSRFPSLELDVNNLQVLCEVCNIGKSNADATDWRPEEFGA